MMGRVLGIVYRTLATHQIRKAGHTHESARTGAVTLIQRFGSALNLNIHFHMLLLDGVYTGGHAAQAKPCCQRVKAPDREELEQLVYAISERTGRYLERQGVAAWSRFSTVNRWRVGKSDPRNRRRSAGACRGHAGKPARR